MMARANEDLIEYAYHKSNPMVGERSDRFHVAAKNLTKQEAADLLVLIAQLQARRADATITIEPAMLNDDRTLHGPQHWIDPAQNGEDAVQPTATDLQIMRFTIDGIEARKNLRPALPVELRDNK